MEQIFLNKTIATDNPSLTDEGLAVYIALRNRREYEIDLILYEYLAYQLTGKINKTSLIPKLKNGIHNLHELNLIEIISDTGKQIEANLEKLSFETRKDSDKFQPFVIIKRAEIRAIMNSKTKFPMKLLRYFVVVVSTICNGSYDGLINNSFAQNVGSYSIDHLANMALISRDTAIDYNRYLEKLGLLFIARSKNAIVNEQGIITKGFSNCYGRPEHEKEINVFQSKRDLNIGRGMRNLVDADTKRSFAQRYNYLLRVDSIDATNIQEVTNIREVYEYYMNENHKLESKISKIKKQHEKGITFDGNSMAVVAELIMKKKDLSHIEKLLEEIEQREQRNELRSGGT